MSKRAMLIVLVGASILGGAATFWGYKIFDQIEQQQLMQAVLSKELATARTQLHGIQQAVRQEPVGASASSTNWREVQRRVEHGVVQVFSSMGHIHWLKPYRSPDEVVTTGSAFFINEKGDMLTNYHVVGQARSVMVRIPRLGQQQYRARVVGACPERDVALLALTDAAREEIEKKLGDIQPLRFGDSDQIGRTQEVMALGFPLGRSSLKSTIGNISGWDNCGGKSLIQLTSPLNPGNSGGPAVNVAGEVIGINAAGIPSAQNTGFCIPINEISHILEDLYKKPLVRKPVLGADFSFYLDTMREYLGNPEGGGWYVTHVYKDTMLDRVGVKEGDVLYDINGYALDCYGEVEVAWSPDSRVSAMDLLNRYSVGDTIHMIFYRKGEKREVSLMLDDSFVLPVRRLFPEFEKIDYELCGGMVIVPLSINVISALLEYDNSLASVLTRYARPDAQYEQALIITHVFPDSPAKDAKLLEPGLIIESLNGKPVRTLTDLRSAILKGRKEKFLTITTQYDRRFIVLSYDEIRTKEAALARQNGYAISPLVKALGGKA